MDPLFKARFGISTSIVYIWDVRIEQADAEHFRTKWSSFWKKQARKKQERRSLHFDKQLRKLTQAGDDVACCHAISIEYINPQVGYGVFAKENIKPYTFLNQYGGILRKDKVIETGADSVFMFSDFKAYSIDASQMGNWTRFMNHTSGRGQANVVAWEHWSPQGPHIVFTAGHRGIQKGSQLLYNYGDSYWDAQEDAILL